ncbi:MAG: hypothetical protein J0G30_00560 [Actinomycetales bacterium]|nr:hypothetical protein [Actinomycetales bacterium]
MEFGGTGTAIMIAIAAALWFLYLLPTWLRRREERAAEAAERRRLTVGVESAGMWTYDEAEPAAVASPEVAAEPGRPARAGAAERDAATRAELQRVRQRRARRLAAGLLLASIVALVVQGWILTTTAATVASWIILAAAAGGVVLSIAVQRRLDQRRPLAAPARRRRATPLQDIDLEEVAARGEDWTPVPVPKPLYLSRAEVRPAAAGETGSLGSTALAAQLRAASAASQQRLRDAHRGPEVARPAASAPRGSEVAAGLRAAPDGPPARVERGAPGGNRYATMGILDDSALGGTDLDAILERRRRVS